MVFIIKLVYMRCKVLVRCIIVKLKHHNRLLMTHWRWYFIIYWNCKYHTLFRFIRWKLIITRGQNLWNIQVWIQTRLLILRLLHLSDRNWLLPWWNYLRHIQSNNRCLPWRKYLLGNKLLIHFTMHSRLISLYRWVADPYWKLNYFSMLVLVPAWVSNCKLNNITNYQILSIKRWGQLIHQYVFFI